MILSIPFLASDPRQFDPGWVDLGYGVEASLFERRDITDDDTWQRVMATVRRIASDYEPPSFTFHFPVNDCDYLASKRIADRLREALDLVGSAGLDGMVLHSNRLRPVDYWRPVTLAAERAAYLKFAAELRQRIEGAPFWVGLENMPILGNDGTDADPLLVVQADYQGMLGGNLGATWDFCHYSLTVHYCQRVRVPDDHFPYPEPVPRFADDFGFEDRIKHYHFSAFRGVPDVSAGTVCSEGQLPWQSTLPEEIYARAFRRIAADPTAKAVTLEIQENDYCDRRRVFEVARWCRALSDVQGGHADG